MAFSCELCLENFEEELVFKNHLEVVHPDQADRPVADQTVRPLKIEVYSALSKNNYENKITSEDLTLTSGTISTNHQIVIICHICSNESNSQDAHARHVKSHQKGSKWICKQCRKSCESEEELIDHIKNYPHVLHKCEICSKEMKTYDQLYKHRSFHTKPHKCKYCQKSFSSLYNKKSHEDGIHLGVKHDCQVCSKTFKYSSALTKHMKKHQGDFSHQCKYCPMSFLDKWSKKKHELRHTSKKDAKCPHCDQEFFKTDLDRHIRAVHLKEKKFECEHCGKKFFCTYKMKQHVEKLHVKKDPNAIKQHQCELCQKRFAYRSSYTRHLKRHQDGKMPCPHCSKIYPKYYLREHIKSVHLDEKKYKCDNCDKKFYGASKLRQHVKKRHQRKNETNMYKCDICSKDFETSTALNRHMEEQNCNVESSDSLSEDSEYQDSN